jgi:D-xylonolactonase
MEIEIVADFACRCAERPTWDPEAAQLYFTDNETTHLFRYDQRSGQAEKVYDGPLLVGAMTLHEDGRLMLFMARGAIALWQPGTELEILLESIAGEEESRFNDVLADPAGRVYCGTMPVGKRPGRLYRWDPDGTLQVVLEQCGMPNGMGFSPDLRWFYFTNTTARTIERFRYHADSGDLTDRTVLIALAKGQGDPDGLAVDDEGCLWSALYGGGCLVRHSPEGKELSRVALPMASNPTCPVFAGEGSATLYVTTAGGPARPESGKAAGALLRLQVAAKGQKAFRSRQSG